MGKTTLTPDECDTINTIARYQFGLSDTEPFLQASNEVQVLHSRSGRIDRVYEEDDRLCTVTTAGRLTLGDAGGRRLHELSVRPANRVVVDEEAVPFVGAGRNAFAKFVLEVDQRLRPRDEAVVVDDDDHPIAIGRVELSAKAIESFNRGVAVSVRTGFSDD